MKLNIKVITLLFLFLSCISFSQERKNDTIQDQVVNVVKPYSPTVSDAFKIKETPVLIDSNTMRKRQVKYTIFSIPVASTFTPAKGKAASVEKQKRPKLYDNYASLGLGSYSTFLGEVYLSHELNNDQVVSGYLGHHTSLGEIDGVQLDNDFSKTDILVDFTQNNRDFSWKAHAGYELWSYNWYGLPEGVFNDSEIGSIDPGHTFNTIKVGGYVDVYDSFFDRGGVDFRRFSDSYESSENYFASDFGFDIPISDSFLKNTVEFGFLNGSFDNGFETSDPLDYQFINAGLGTSYVISEDDLTVNLGVQLVYLSDSEKGESSFYVYPNIEASYRVVSDVVIAYGGLKGDLIQNTYYDFAGENPFVSPTLIVTPTDMQYHFFLGMKGKVTNEVSYNIKGGYMSENNKALFILNPALTGAIENYEYGNSFGTVYDDVNTLTVEGELNVDITRNFTLGLKAAYFNYNTSAQEEAWNLPDITGSLFVDYQISEKWFAGMSAFFVGERKDQLLINGPLIDEEPTNIILDSFFDLNMHGGYRINDQFSMFVKVNNAFNQDYERWLNFPVQGIQFIAGASYQFDF